MIYVAILLYLAGAIIVWELMIDEAARHEQAPEKYYGSTGWVWTVVLWPFFASASIKRMFRK